MIMSIKLGYGDLTPFQKMANKDRAVISGVLLLLGMESMNMPEGVYPVEHLQDFAKHCGLKRNRLEAVLDYLKSKSIVKITSVCDSTGSHEFLSVPFFYEQWKTQKKNVEFRKEVSGPKGAKVREIPSTWRHYYKMDEAAYRKTVEIIDRFREVAHPGIAYEGMVSDSIFGSIFSSIRSNLGSLPAYSQEDYSLVIKYLKTVDKKFVTMSAFSDDKFPTWLLRAKSWKQNDNSPGQIELVEQPVSKEDQIQKLENQLNALPTMGISERQQETIRRQIEEKLAGLKEIKNG